MAGKEVGGRQLISNPCAPTSPPVTCTPTPLPPVPLPSCCLCALLLATLPPYPPAPTPLPPAPPTAACPAQLWLQPWLDSSGSTTPTMSLAGSGLESCSSSRNNSLAALQTPLCSRHPALQHLPLVLPVCVVFPVLSASHHMVSPGVSPHPCSTSHPGPVQVAAAVAALAVALALNSNMRLCPC